MHAHMRKRCMQQFCPPIPFTTSIQMAPVTGIARTLAAATWPVSNIIIAANIPESAVEARALRRKKGKLYDEDTPDSRPEFRGKPAATTFMDHLNVQMATFPKLMVATIVYMYFFPKDISAFASLDFSNFSSAKAAWTLIQPIFIRDLVITWIAAGFWDFVVFFSPLSAKFEVNKFNPEPAKMKQRLHDMFWSHVSTFISTLFEVLVLYWMAKGTYPAANPAVWYKDPSTIAWVLSMPYWRLTHFFFLHRGMHPWRTTVIPDVGQFLYNWVHSLHHTSKNSISWSGISMHPVESSGYYTAMLVPVLAGPALASLLTYCGVPPATAWLSAHPIVMLYTKVDLTMAALIGHDGVGFPGGGSQAHWLHHNNFECNYGENYAPFDWLFGTFAADEDDFVAKFGSLPTPNKASGKKSQ